MYRIELSRQANKNLSLMSANIRKIITGKLIILAENPYAPNNNVTNMVDAPGYRLRVGDYRVVYTLEDELRVLFVEKVGPRGSVYDA